MRPIDADELKKDLTRFYDNEVTAKQLIDEQPTIQPEQRWIPCSERLPEDDTEVLVYLFENNKSPYIAWLCDGRWYTEYFEVEREDEPVAWMPLPEPYREGGKMGDLISRQAAIDFVGSMNMCDEISNEACKKLTSYLDELPSIQPEHRWIPCSERLPVPYEDVWCCSDIGQVVGYCDATGFWVGRGELELIVTAWMPLPEPYQEGGQE